MSRILIAIIGLLMMVSLGVSLSFYSQTINDLSVTQWIVLVSGSVATGLIYVIFAEACYQHRLKTLRGY